MTKENVVERKKQTQPVRSNIIQDNKKIILEMMMPGVIKENLDIRIESNRLIIDGKKTNPELKGSYKVHEISDQDYHQEFTIDHSIDRSKINAVLKNGMVIVELAIREEEKARKITVVQG